MRRDSEGTHERNAEDSAHRSGSALYSAVGLQQYEQYEQYGYDEDAHGRIGVDEHHRDDEQYAD